MLLIDLVDRSPVTVVPEATVREAARRMRERQVGSVIVLDEGSVVGILTDRDVVMAIAEDRFGGPDQRVADLMTPEPTCLGSDQDVERGLAAMRGRGVRRLPVLNDDGELVGVVSLDDVLMHMGRSLGAAADLVREEVAAGGERSWPDGRAERGAT
ncbi:MAG: CBS domain-containing protein [Gemmatimonadota bacterium]|nr:CBS domain-containing protein [Gemmatimonadota bacterium]